MLNNLNHWIGRQKEQSAKQWLEAQGIQIIAENFHCKGGEIDLIGLEQQTLLFIEVKYRKNTAHGSPEETVTYRKQQKLQLCAQVYLQQKPQHAHRMLRFDVIAIIGNQPPVWLKNAF